MSKPADAPRGEVVLYESPGGEIRVEVRLERETVWLSLNQIAELFGRDKSVISRHLRNVFDSGELVRESVVAKIATTAADGKTYQVEYFNLDAILSVGYRVNSKRGTQFRVWATRILRDHLVRGYTLNQKRLQEQGLAEIQETLSLLTRTLTQQGLVIEEGQAVLDLIERYAYSWRLLFEYDEERLARAPAHPLAPKQGLAIEAARAAIDHLRRELLRRGAAGDLFGLEQDGRLEAILAAVEQTVRGEPAYRSVQERAAHLLYFIIKDHPFVDGNKRIGSLLFLEYLRRNDTLLLPDGKPRFANNALVALALLTAESNPSQKDLMVRFILNLLEDTGE